MRREPTGSQMPLRDRNRRMLIDELRRAGLTSRAELARRTGLSRSTVSTLVAEMQGQGLVVEREVDGAGPLGGRPPVLLSLERAAGVALGIDFGKRHVRVIVCDLARAVRADLERQMDTEHSAQDGFVSVTELARQAFADVGATPAEVIGAGIGVRARPRAAGDPPLRDEVARHAVPAAGGRVEIVAGALGRRAEVLGAAALVLRDVAGFAFRTPREVAQQIG